MKKKNVYNSRLYVEKKIDKSTNLIDFSLKIESEELLNLRMSLPQLYLLRDILNNFNGEENMQKVFRKRFI